MHKIFISGGAGFVGSHLCEKINKNYKKSSIIILDKLTYAGNKNFIKTLTEKLLLWTGERWIITLSKNTDAKSIYEKNLEDRDKKIEEFKKGKIAQDIKKIFPDAKLIDLMDEE